MASVSADAEWTSARSVAGGHNPWSIVGVISIATLMVTLDTTIVNVALAHIAGSLSSSYDEATWVATSYLLANAAIIPASGWFADLIGRKRYYMISVGLFAGSSLVCGFAPNLAILIVARIMQGIGGGGLAPVEQSMLADTFPPSKRGLAFAAYGGVVILGPIAGPILGGWITDNLSWHWAFLINVPIALLSLTLVKTFVDEPKAVRERTAQLRASGFRFDYTGFALAALWLGSMEVTLDRGQTDDWFASPVITACAILAALSFLALIPWEFMRKNPLINVHLFRSPNFSISGLMLIVLGVILFGSLQLIPQLLQEVLGYTATDAGLALTLGGTATLVALPMAGVLSSRIDARYLIAFGFATQAYGFWQMGHLSTEMAFYNATTVRLVQSFGLPFLFVPINTVAYVGIKPEQNNQASALMNVLRNMGGTIGISTQQTLLSRHGQIHQSRLVERLNNLNPPYANAIDKMTHALSGQGAQASGIATGSLYQSTVQQAQMLSYIDVFHFFLVTTLCMLPLVLIMRKAQSGGAAGGAL